MLPVYTCTGKQFTTDSFTVSKYSEKKFQWPIVRRSANQILESEIGLK